MPRTIVDIPDMLLVEVDALCKLLGISRADATRQALRAFVLSHHNVVADGFGLWSASDPANPTNPTNPASQTGFDKGLP